MITYKTIKYTNDHYTIWNDFVAKAKNATFLFHRDFMEYHSDRFTDFSLLVFNDKGKLKAILPANISENILYSHQGLTYGGLILDQKSKLSETLAIFENVLFFLHANSVLKINIKTIPNFYCDTFSDELNYCFFIVNAKLTQTDSLSTINLTKPFFITKTRKESIRRGEKNNLEIKEELNFELFWNAILIPNLQKKHNVKPVHSVEEIINLQQQFAENIRHFNVYFNNEIVAGTTVFINKNVVHPQYISGNENKNSLGSLDYLYHYLITDVFKNYTFFDFGISNEKKGTKINKGLLFWKESFGAKTVTQNFYEIETKNFINLKSVLI